MTGTWVRAGPRVPARQAVLGRRAFEGTGHAQGRTRHRPHHPTHGPDSRRPAPVPGRWSLAEVPTPMAAEGARSVHPPEPVAIAPSVPESVVRTTPSTSRTR